MGPAPRFARQLQPGAPLNIGVRRTDTHTPCACVVHDVCIERRGVNPWNKRKSPPTVPSAGISFAEPGQARIRPMFSSLRITCWAQ